MNIKARFTLIAILMIVVAVTTFLYINGGTPVATLFVSVIGLLLAIIELFRHASASKFISPSPKKDSFSSNIKAKKHGVRPRRFSGWEE